MFDGINGADGRTGQLQCTLEGHRCVCHALAAWVGSNLHGLSVLNFRGSGTRQEFRRPTAEAAESLDDFRY